MENVYSDDYSNTIEAGGNLVNRLAEIASSENKPEDCECEAHEWVKIGEDMAGEIAVEIENHMINVRHLCWGFPSTNNTPKFLCLSEAEQNALMKQVKEITESLCKIRDNQYLNDQGKIYNDQGLMIVKEKDVKAAQAIERAITYSVRTEEAMNTLLGLYPDPENRPSSLTLNLVGHSADCSPHPN